MGNEIASYTYISRQRKITTCALYEHYLIFTTRSSKKQPKNFKIPYDSIYKIHLDKTDVGWYGMDIYLKDRQRFHFKSVAFYRELDSQIKRIKITPADIQFSKTLSNNYRLFLLALHGHLRAKQLSEKILFTYGNTVFKLFILAAIILTAAVILPMALHFSSIGRIFFLITAMTLLFVFYFKIGFKKNYSVDKIPENYLPAIKLIEE